MFLKGHCDFVLFYEKTSSEIKWCSKFYGIDTVNLISIFSYFGVSQSTLTSPSKSFLPTPKDLSLKIVLAEMSRWKIGKNEC